MPGWPIRVNSGRKPTPIGGDGILPYVDVPHWLSAALVHELKRHRIEYRVRAAYIRRADSTDPNHHWDRFVFPHAQPIVVQKLVDSIIPDDYR